jgi:hypothetical protein
VLEVTERAVVQHPAELLRLVDWARQRSWGIALDDIGEDPGSLAMMPFLEPDVIKLDLRLVQQRPTAEIGLIMSAVLAQAERTGRRIVAEGVEDDAMRRRPSPSGRRSGRAGCTAARCAPGPAAVRWTRSYRCTARGRCATTRRRSRSSGAPCRCGAPARRSCSAWPRTSRSRPSPGPTARGALDLPDRRGARRPHARALRPLAGRGSFVAAMRSGGELTWATASVTGVLPDGHRTGGGVVGRRRRPHYAGALVARQVGEDPAEGYDYVVTHSRELVVEAGRSLLRHVAPAGEERAAPRVESAVRRSGTLVPARAPVPVVPHDDPAAPPTERHPA